MTQVRELSPAKAPTVDQVARAATKAHHDAANAIENDAQAKLDHALAMREETRRFVDAIREQFEKEAQIGVDEATAVRAQAKEYADTLREQGDRMLDLIAAGVERTRAKADAILAAGEKRPVQESEAAAAGERKAA